MSAIYTHTGYKYRVETSIVVNIEQPVKLVGAMVSKKWDLYGHGKLQN